MVALNLNLLLALLWKNFKIRWKNKVSWIIDILLPTLMCAFLILISTTVKPKVIPNCNIKAKALPTASGMLFLQTFLCTASNICEDEKNASFESLKPSLLSNVGEAIEKAFNIKPKKLRDLRLNNWSKEFHVIDSLIEAIDNENKRWQLLYNTFLRSNIYSAASDSENSVINKLLRIKRNVLKTEALNSVIRALRGEDQGTVDASKNFLNLFFCGPNIQEIESQLISIATDIASKNTKEDDTMSEYCNNAIKIIESSNFKLILQFLKPLLFGKVVYTPDAPVINRIMDNFGDSFMKVKNVLDLLMMAGRAWTELKEWKLNDVISKYKNENFLREVVKTRTRRGIVEGFENETNNDSEEKSLKRQIEVFKKLLKRTGENYNVYLQNEDSKAKIFYLLQTLECIDFDKVIAKSSEGDAMTEAHKWLNKDRLWGYIIFTNVPPGAEKLPSSVTYKMRLPFQISPDTKYTKHLVNKTGPVNTPIKNLKEIQGGAVYLQNMIEGELIREYTKRNDTPGIYLRQLPYPCYLEEEIKKSGIMFLRALLPFGYVTFYCRIVKRIVREKEILFKDILRVFGVVNAHHWLAFFIESLFTGCLAALICSLVLKSIYGYFAVIFLHQIVYVISIIGLAFLTSTFLMKTSYCTLLASSAYILLYIISNALVEVQSAAAQVFLCFISIYAFLCGIIWLEGMITSGVALEIELLNYSPSRGNSITMLLVIIMLIIDSLIYILLAVYLENVISSRASRKPWNYCLKASYWKGCCKKNEPSVESSEPQTTSPRKKKDSKNFEAEPEGKVGIEVIGVSKEFGRSKNKIRVVNKLSLNFYEDQITSFLGHNGAGKSTTVLMMTGVLRPTEGTIRIYGVDLQKNPQAALSSVGICFQENVIIDELSARDHLLLMGKLRGLGKNETKRNLDELLEEFELTSRANQPVKHLSGGWKRKVCVAMAFMGGSRTIFLDEPTAGIDPFARRSIWDILVKLKKGRTIVLITHHLDEADILGDRIAIIASGELKCCGSSSFLKSNLDKGYILTVDTTVRTQKTSSKSNKNSKKQMSSQAQELLGVVKSAIHGAEMEEERGCEYIFSLPQKQSSSDLNRLFDALDRNKKKNNINSYGVSAVSLEEVFFNVLMKTENVDKNSKNAASSARRKSYRDESNEAKSSRSSKEVLPEEQSKFTELSEIPPAPSPPPQPDSDHDMKQIISLRHKEKFRARRMFWNHIFVLWVKRIQHSKRNYIFLLVQILLPPFLVLTSLITNSSTNFPSATIDISAYDSSIIFYTNDRPGNPHLSSYENALLGPYGLGTKCILSPEKCSLKRIPNGSMIAEGKTIDSNNCTCNDGKLVCEGNATAEPPEAEMTTGHKLINMTGLNLNNWLIATEFKYSIKRIGGIAFGHVSSIPGLSVGDFLSLFSEKNLLKILEKYLLGDKQKIEPKKFTSELMAGLNQSYGEKLFKGRDSADNIIIWFNSADTTANMALINGVTNLVLRASLPSGTDPSDYSIQLIVHPFPGPVSALGSQFQFSSFMNLILLLIMSLCILFSLAIIYLVDERFCGMKHLAFISGVNPLEYWFAYFIWDIVIFSACFILILILILIFNLSYFSGRDTLPVFTAALYSYAATTFIFIYLLSHLFKVSSSAIIFIVIWCTLIGPIVFLAYQLIKSIESLEEVTKMLLIIPECAFANCLLNLALTSSQNSGVSRISYFQWDISTKFICHILINGGVYLLLLILIEYQNVLPLGLLVRGCASLKILGRRSKKRDEDEDVTAEKVRVQSKKAKEDGDLLIMKNLTKVYCGQGNPATNHVYVGVKQGECLGLLGMNGAGKTTIFKMISGAVVPTLGDATIGGFSITFSPIKSRILIGYCPQSNALDPYLTTAEHLSFFLRIRGYSGKKIKKEVDTLIELMNLNAHKNKISKNLSGGNQRKLNAAIALLSEPDIILLDEPTAGMDVMARRFLWSRLLEVLQDGRCLILTTHSMEECQALATQVGIMYKGQFVCFGTSQHLKNKFNDGYSATMRLVSPDKQKDITNYLNEHLHGFTVVRAHNFYLHIKLHPDTNIGKAVTVMGEIKKKQWIEDYSLNQTTLESVFLKLIGEVNREKAYEKPACSC